LVAKEDKLMAMREQIDICSSTTEVKKVWQCISVGLGKRRDHRVDSEFSRCYSLEFR